ncbi:31417_t:CDS:2 [Racocetra persica]|uniref:31417_t:CDS:1 n=1 Tax=Racocetra persica TaxID=160502 RepID=A0ACA9KUS2_9GLOM|nr:31417_t:CDS:2 [Racocetra persica]
MSSIDHVLVVESATQEHLVNNFDSNSMPSSTPTSSNISDNNGLKESKYSKFLQATISKDIETQLFFELYGNTNKNNNSRWLQTKCFVLANLQYGFTKPEENTYDRYVMHLIVMMRFVFDDQIKARTSTFAAFYNSQQESKDYPLYEKDSTFYINYLFCCLLDIKAVEGDFFFEDLVYSAFPRGRDMLLYKRKKANPPSINRNIDLSMEKMQKFLLDFEKTEYMDEHLTFKKNKVSIFNYDFKNEEFMNRYSDNRLAQKYGIEMVGLEIMKTYTFLMNSKKSKDLMFEYNIWNADGFEDVVLAIIKGRTVNIGYTVLADKFFGLEKTINSFLFRFQREASHRRLYQPVDYYFIVFSIFLGFLTILQTLTGIASLILQINSM